MWDQETIDIVTTRGPQGTVEVTPGNVQKQRLRYSLIPKGEFLISVTGSVSAGAVSTISAVTLTDDKRGCYFFITASNTAEDITISLRATLTDGQVFNNTLAIKVEA